MSAVFPLNHDLSSVLPCLPRLHLQTKLQTNNSVLTILFNQFISKFDILDAYSRLGGALSTDNFRKSKKY